MIYFAVFTIALVMTVALIPPLIQVSDRIGLLDIPDKRKVHDGAIPRVGGIGMVLGILVPLMVWAELDTATTALLAGIAVIFFFGVWDDSGDLDYRLKFIGQIIAACVVVFYGDVTVKVIPFMGLDPVSPWVYYPLSILAIVAVTNAINLADGLDGLAAGVVLLTLSGVVIIAFLADGTNLMLVALAVAGTILGFLRFNTYPARIFMGDTGSQFLGFSMGVLMILLTQNVNPALNPALPLLLLGLPVFDTLFVIVKRIYYGKSPFAPDKNHIHHQLLALNFDHYEAVIIIYVVQAIFVFSGIALRYQSDLLVVGGWLIANLFLAKVLVAAGRASWRAHGEKSVSMFAQLVESGIKGNLYRLSIHIIRISVSVLLIAGPLLVDAADYELGLASAVLGILLLLRLVMGNRLWFILLRLILFVAIAFVVYLVDQWIIGDGSEYMIYEYAYLGVIALALVLGARYSIDDAFTTTPTDYLIVIIMVGFTLIPNVHPDDGNALPIAVKLVIMFYAIEVLLHHLRGRWSLETISSLWAFAVIAARGLLPI